MYGYRLSSYDWTVVTEFNYSTNPHNRGAAVHPHLQCCHLVKVTEDNHI